MAYGIGSAAAGQAGMEQLALTILVVEEALSLQGSIGAILINAGFEVIGAGTTRQAVLAVLEGCIDLVLLDRSVEAFGDLEFLELLREDLQWHDLPVIVLTEEAEEDGLERIEELGVDLMVAKSPDIIESLPSIVREVHKIAREST